MFKSNTPEETHRIGLKFAESLNGDEIIIVSGELGVGKTHLIKGIAEYFNIDSKEVNSPTFTIMNVYYGRIVIYHLDLYRVSEEEAEEIISEIEGKGIIILEWGEKLNPLYFDNAKYFIEMEYDEELNRKIKIGDL
jgi:tRNA threonylcarbamoyladenosine biosynthesis protein TsaE